MIESVSRIVTTSASRLPSLFEVPIMSANFVQTLWMTAEQFPTHTRITHVDSGESFNMDAFDEVTWLQPEDMHSPSLQAELITALASKGIEL